jgi:hypothetical protein
MRMDRVCDVALVAIHDSLLPGVVVGAWIGGIS